MQIDLTIKYTVIPITDKDQINIIQKYLNNKQFPSKASMCRFFLRGLCIFKKQYCRFAHGMDQLVEYKMEPQPELTDKALKKRDAAYRSFFNQKPSLFIIPKSSYANLCEYNNQTSCKKLTIDEVNTQTSIRNKLRTRFHKYQWQKMIQFLEKLYPQANLTIPWITEKYVEYGFTKPHTHCRVQGFVFWVNTCNFYIKHTILLPPSLVDKTTLVFKRYSKRPFDKLLYADFENQLKKGKIDQIPELVQKQSQIDVKDPQYQKKQLIHNYLTGKKPQNYKQCICKFYMKGVCFFTQQQCHYCHSFQTLVHIPRESKITDFQHYQQKSLFFENKRNYIALYKFQERMIQIDPAYEHSSLQRVNTNSYLRQILRQNLHMDLYRQFMTRMRKEYLNIPLSIALIRKQYNNCRLNKVQSDKFPSFIQKIQDLGYQLDSFIIPPQTKKRQYIFQRPSLALIEQQFSVLFIKIIQQKISTSDKNQNQPHIITQTYVRKKFYQHQQPLTIALHRYLKLQSITLKEFIQKQIDTNQSLQPHLKLISFDLKENLEKIKEVLREFYHQEKNRVEFSYGEIEGWLRKECGDRITNHFTSNSFKWFVLEQSREMKKQIYILPDGGIVLRKGSGKGKEKNKEKKQEKEKEKQVQNIQELPNVLSPVTLSKSLQPFLQYSFSRIVLIDSPSTLLYSSLLLPSIPTLGVDLEGNLSQSGYIYLIQLGFKNPLNNFQNQTLVFDIWKLKQDPELFNKAVNILQQVLESKKTIKVMHDCRNDSVALYHLLKINLTNVFDTAAMNVYFDQLQLNHSNLSRQQFVKQLIKISNKNAGLNAILQKYNRAVNKLKEKMKGMFEADEKEKRVYFEKRPIEQEFLEYAVRDVEELVDVFEEAVGQDKEGQWRRIGEVAARTNIKN